MTIRSACCDRRIIDFLAAEHSLNWKVKANIQRLCAALPASEAVYYLLQSRVGVFRKDPDPMPNLQDAAGLLAELPFPVDGKRVMEVGTGRRIDMPIAFFLAGAEAVDTVDLYRYLKPELVFGSIRNMLRQREAVCRLFQPWAARPVLERRLDLIASATSFDALSEATGIRYHAPADARRTSLADGTVDLHFSYTVFEHIPGDVLRDILVEARRVLRPDTGVACHHIDMSDHFVQVDPAISKVNFLRYEDAEWSRYNDNQFAYHNRLRAADYEKIYADAGHEIVARRDWVDERSLAEIRSGFPLAARYRNVDPLQLATVNTRVTSR